MGSVTCSTKGLIQTGNLVSFYIGRSARKRTKPTNFSAVGFVQSGLVLIEGCEHIIKFSGANRRRPFGVGEALLNNKSVPR